MNATTEDAPSATPPDILKFLERARHAGTIRLELRVDGGREEATSVVCSFDMPAKGSLQALAQDIYAAGDADASALQKGLSRYIVVAWTERGPFGRHALTFGTAQASHVGGFSENDATAHGIIAELIRDRQFNQKLLVNAYHAMSVRSDAEVTRLSTMQDRTESKYLELVDALESVYSHKEDRELKREELRIKQATQERMVETIAPLAKPIANRLLGKLTGEQAILAPEMFDDIAEALFEDKTQGRAMAIMQVIPEKNRAGLFELLRIFEQRYEAKKAEKAKDEERKLAIKAEQDKRMAEGPHPPIRLVKKNEAVE